MSFKLCHLGFSLTPFLLYRKHILGSDKCLHVRLALIWNVCKIVAYFLLTRGLCLVLFWIEIYFCLI